MTDQNIINNNENNELNEIDNSISNGDQTKETDQIKETIPNTSNRDLEIVVTQEDQNVPSTEFSKKLQIGNTKLLIVDKEEDVISGEAPNCCVLGSPEHVS